MLLNISFVALSQTAYKTRKKRDHARRIHAAVLVVFSFFLITLFPVPRACIQITDMVYLLHSLAPGPSDDPRKVSILIDLDMQATLFFCLSSRRDIK